MRLAQHPKNLLLKTEAQFYQNLSKILLKMLPKMQQVFIFLYLAPQDQPLGEEESAQDNNFSQNIQKPNYFSSSNFIPNTTSSYQSNPSIPIDTDNIFESSNIPVPYALSYSKNPSSPSTFYNISLPYYDIPSPLFNQSFNASDPSLNLIIQSIYYLFRSKYLYGFKLFFFIKFVNSI